MMNVMRKTDDRKNLAVFESCESRQLMAATWYVAPTGSDNNAGTLAKPVASLNSIMWRLKPGDTVLLRGGTYHWTEQQPIYADGNATGHITITSYPGERAIVDGAGVKTGWLDAMSISGDYVDFSNITIQNSQGNGLTLYQPSHVTVRNCTISKSVSGGIWVGGDAAFSDIRIEGNVVNDNSQKTAAVKPTGGGWAEGISISKGAGIVVRGNTVFNNHGEGIGLWNSAGGGNIIESNRVYDNYSVNVYVYNATGGTVRNNIIYSLGNTKFYRAGIPASGLQVATEMGSPYPVSSGNLFYNNIVTGTGWGFYYGNYMTGGGLIDTVVANNTFVNCTAGSVNIDYAAGSRNSRFVNNIVYQSNGKSLTRVNNTPGVTFDHNLWYGGTVEAKAKSTTDILKKPLFTKLGGYKPADYTLTATSPGINAGVTIKAIATDILGAKRLKGTAVDLGAVESV